VSGLEDEIDYKQKEQIRPCPGRERKIAAAAAIL